MIPQESKDKVRGRVLGYEIEFSGRESIYLLMTLATLGLCVFLLYQHTDSTRLTLAEQTRELSRQHSELRNDHSEYQQLLMSTQRDLLRASEAIMSAIREQNYILALSPEDRERLKMEMPESLRTRLLPGPHERKHP